MKNMHATLLTWLLYGRPLAEVILSVQLASWTLQLQPLKHVYEIFRFWVPAHLNVDEIRCAGYPLKHFFIWVLESCPFTRRALRCVGGGAFFIFGLQRDVWVVNTFEIWVPETMFT